MSSAREKETLTDRIEVEIGSESRQLYQKILEQWKLLAAAAAVVIVFAAAYGGYGAYQDRRLAKAELELDRAVLENSGVGLLAALEQLQGSLPKAMLPRYWLESARAAQDLGEWDKALGFWTMLAEKGPDHWSLLGGLGRNTALMRLGRPAEALTGLESLRAKAPEDMMPTLLLQLAEASEMAGEWARALAVYEELQARGDSSQPGFLEFKTSGLRQKLATGKP